jgi:hypothetical protein
MTTHRALAADRRVTTRAVAALLTCLLALSLTAIMRSHEDGHHVAHGKPAIGVSVRDAHQVAARLDQHATADPASATRTTLGVRAARTDPITLLDARRLDATRVRGPPGRIA